MTWLPDRVVDHLREVCDTPDLSGTRYTLIGKIGSGGMGVVYQVEDTLLHRRVAMKVVAVEDAELRKRTRDEARTLASLSHPGIVPVYDMGDLPDGRTFFVMQLLDGLRLDAYREQETSLSELLRVFQKICDAVAFAHAHGIVHRDLKPANIMVGRFGQVWVMDWGLASAPADGRFPSKTLRGGTPAYMAPEQGRHSGQAITERTDVFGLGALLHFLLSGRPPEPRPPEPPPLASVVRRATANDPEHRYAGARQVRQEIDRFLNQQKPYAHKESLGETLERVLRKHYFPITLVAIYLVTRIAVFVLLGR